MIVLAMTLLVLLLMVAAPTGASSAFQVSASPASPTFPAGANGIFIVRLEGSTDMLPSLDYAVEGASLEGVVSLNVTGPSTAEGAVHVRRDSAGTARLIVSFGGTTLATAEARFVPMGAVQVQVTMNAGINAAARTWRFEVVNASGQVAATLSAGTSGDAPTATVTSAMLPHGFYTVRQMLGSDTRTACAPGVFYEVAAPVSAATTIELASATARAVFTIRPCADLPRDLQVSIPVDVVAPSAGGVVGEADVLASQPPIDEVRGTRQAGPGPLPARTGNIPLPPRTGNTSAGTEENRLPLVFIGLLLLVSAPAAIGARAARERLNR